MIDMVFVLLIASAEILIAASASAQYASPRPLVIHSFDSNLSGVRAANPEVHLSVGRDPSKSDEPVLFVEYPAPTNEPAGRDVQCDAESRDWTPGKAISFQVKPSHDTRLSISFFDRNHVVYTAWTDLKAGVWQPVRVAFDEIRPNPYFQPPDARLGLPIDVSEVRFVAFAPQDRTSGRLAIGKFVVAK
jgi:hypothetical protein